MFSIRDSLIDVFRVHLEEMVERLASEAIDNINLDDFVDESFVRERVDERIGILADNVCDDILDEVLDDME